MSSEVIFFFKQLIKYFKLTLRFPIHNIWNQYSTFWSSKYFCILLFNAILEVWWLRIQSLLVLRSGISFSNFARLSFLCKQNKIITDLLLLKVFNFMI